MLLLRDCILSLLEGHLCSYPKVACGNHQVVLRGLGRSAVFINCVKLVSLVIVNDFFSPSHILGCLLPTLV